LPLARGDQHVFALDILVQDWWHVPAVKRFIRSLLAGLQFEPSCITDGLRIYVVAQRDVLPGIRH
jgi:putative transposase